MRQILPGLILLVLAVPLQAADSAGKVVRESWYETRTDQGKLGSLHLQACEVERDGQKLIRTTLREQITYLRSGDPYHDLLEQECVEKPDGSVVEFAYSITLSKRQKLRLHGVLEGKDMVFHVLDEKGARMPFSQRVPWDHEARGLYAQDRYFEGRTLAAGQTLTVKVFNPYANRVLVQTYKVKPKAPVEVGGECLCLPSVELSYPRDAYLTPSTLWIDSRGRVVKMLEDDSTLFGALTRELTTRENATAKFKAKVRDKDAPVLADQPISVRRGKPAELTVRISVKGDNNPGTLFDQDGRQKLVKADDQTVELRLLARAPKPEGPSQPVPAEYLQNNFFIRSEDPLVKKYAREAVGEEKDAREQLRLLRKWIGRKVRGNYEVAFATADEVAQTLEGDCSEMGVLAAAMCRAVGIPSRIAFGLVYDSDNQGFGGHLWTEVHVDGQWEPFDATGVLNTLNAAYIRVASYSMKDVLNPDELVEVRRAFAGPMRVQVIEAK